MSKLVAKFRSILAPAMDMCVFQSEKGQVSFGISKWKGKDEAGTNIYEKIYLNGAEFQALYEAAYELLELAKSTYSRSNSKVQVANTPPVPVPENIAKAFPGSTATTTPELVDSQDDIPF